MKEIYVYRSHQFDLIEFFLLLGESPSEKVGNFLMDETFIKVSKKLVNFQQNFNFLCNFILHKTFLKISKKFLIGHLHSASEPSTQNIFLFTQLLELNLI
jgi:hypothetical protein